MKKTLLLLFFGLLILRGPIFAQNPYESLGKVAPVLTLSEGKYQEFMTNDTIVQIGSVLFNTITSEVIAFVVEDSIRLVDADLTTRFLSVDPLGRKYPELTPYQFASNTPIMAIDLDGLEELRITDKFELGFDTELKILRSDAVLSKSFIDIQNPALKDKHLVIFKFDKDTRQASTQIAYSDNKITQNFIKYYKENPDKLSEDIAKRIDRIVNPIAENTGLTKEEVTNEILKGRSIHVVNFNPLEITAELSWTLNDFLHEIDFHLKNNINGVERTLKHEDHKKAFMYDKLTPEQQKIIDGGVSISPKDAPENSDARKLGETIDSQIKKESYKKDTSKEKYDKQIEFIRALPKEKPKE